MANAILIHGWNTKAEYYDMSRPTASNDHWFPWLTKQLIVKGVHTVSLEMPNGYYPEYEVWKRELERYDLDEETILVGHSCGGGFLVRWLSETDKKVCKVILVAPWLGYGYDDEPFDATFFDFTMGRDIARKTIEGIALFNSTDDVDTVHKSVNEILEKVDNIKYHELENRGHFTLLGLGGPEFPELLEEALA